MSSLGEIGLIGGIFVVGALPFFYATVETNRRGDEIAIGVVKGVAVSLEFRWLLLIHMCAGLAIGVVLYLAAVAVVMLRLAENATSAGAESLAYILAMVSGGGAACWFVLAASYISYCTRLLRRAERANE